MKRMMVLLVSAMFCGAITASAQVPQTMSHQGLLRETDGPIVPDGPYDLTFRIYDAPAGGSPLWEEAHPGVLVELGIFNVILGKGTPPNPLGLGFDRTYYLSVQIDAEPELVERLELTSSAYTFRSDIAEEVVPDILCGLNGVRNDEGEISLIGGPNIAITADDQNDQILIDVTGDLGDITAVYAENGLVGDTESGDAHLSIGAGDGIEVLADVVEVNVADFAGSGLGEDSNNLNVNTGTGLETSGDAVGLNSSYSSGSAYDGRFVNEGQPSSVTTDMVIPDVVSSLAGVVNDGGNIELIGGSHITITPDDANDRITIEADGGLGDITAVYADDGLAGDTESGDAHLSIGAGDGIVVLEDEVMVDVLDFAGNGLGEASNDLHVNTGTGLEIGADAVGLTASYSSGSAYDGRFVNEDQPNSISTDMVVPDIISSLDGVGNDGGDIDLIGGTNITITPNDTNNTITIDANGADNDWSIVGDDMYSNVTGNVGIGTTSPDNTLHVVGSAGELQYGQHNYLIVKGDEQAVLAVDGGPMHVADVEFRKSGVQKWAIGARGTDGNDLSFLSFSGAWQTLYLDGLNGNVGIGTSSPENTLHVVGGGGELQYGQDNYLVLKGDLQAMLAIDSGPNHAGDVEFMKSGERKWAIGPRGTGGVDLSFFSYSGAGQALYVDGLGGNVGIGTTSPENTLHVVGSEGNLQYGQDSYLVVKGDQQAVLALDSSPIHACDVEFRRSGVPKWSIGPMGTDGVDFRFDSYGGAGQALYLNGQNGNVGIGTTSPARALDVRKDDDDVLYAKYEGSSGDRIAVEGYSVPVDYYGIGGKFTGGWHGVDARVFPTGNGYYRGVDAYVVGGSGTNYAIYGCATGSGTNYAGYFDGHLYASSASAGIKAFKIDHPLDPENQYLSHSSVESPDMMNIYNGNSVLGAGGEAWVELPEWFDALNRDFRYQLTCIGGFAPVYIAEKISGNQFKIAGGEPGMEISWQVTGIRQDPLAEIHRIQVEEHKADRDRGRYLHPEAYGMPETMGVDYPERGKTPR